MRVVIGQCFSVILCFIIYIEALHDDVPAAILKGRNNSICFYKRIDTNPSSVVLPLNMATVTRGHAKPL